MHLSRRDKIAIGVVAVCLVLLVGFWGKFTVPEYEASTLILIDPAKVAELTPQLPIAETRLGLINEELMSSHRLQRIIDTYDLYKTLKGHKTQQEVIERMRSDISVDIVRNPNNVSSIHAFRITYRGTQAPLVAQVTNQLASLFIYENLQMREQAVQGNFDFLNTRLEELRKRIGKAEAELRGAKTPLERELDARDVALLRDYYSKAFTQKLELETAAEIEKHKKSERFTILEPARIPEKPARTRLVLAGW